MGQTRGRTRWVAVAATGLVVMIYLANLPFYAGQSFEGGVSWRMEHGRLTIDRTPGGRPKSFWVDQNSEGLRWSAEWHRAEAGRWSLTIPLWIPLALCLVWCALSWRLRADGSEEVREQEARGKR